MVWQRGKRPEVHQTCFFCKVNLFKLYKMGYLHRNSIIDLSTGPKFDAFFHEGPYGYYDASMPFDMTSSSSVGGAKYRSKSSRPHPF